MSEEKLPTFQEGDFKLVSSDKHTYRVDTHYLQTWS